MIKKIIEAFKNIGLYFFLTIILDLLILIIGIKNSILIESLLILGTIAIAYVLYKVMKDKFAGQWSDFKKNYKSYLRLGLKFWLIGYVLMIISNLFIVTLLGDIAPNESMNREIIDEYLIYAVISMVIFTPFIEETLFRLNFKDCFKGKWSYVLVTGLIFGSLHVLFSLTSVKDLLYIVPYFSLGASFSYIYYETKNIYTSVFIHGMHNLLAVLVILSGI